MRITPKRRAMVSVFAIATTTAIFVLLSSGITKKLFTSLRVSDPTSLEAKSQLGVKVSHFRQSFFQDIPRTQEFRQHTYDVFQALRTFGGLAHNSGIVVCVIEPHILFSMIPEEQQHRLSLRTSFNFAGRKKNIVTVAVEGREEWKLSQNVIKTAFRSVGFSYFESKGSQGICSSNNSTKNYLYLPTHHFYMYQGIIIHVVIFYQQSEYFCHSKLTDLPMEVAKQISIKDLFFAESDSIYDRFNVSPMAANRSYQGLYVPDHIERFLFEIPASRMIKCLSQPRRVYDSQNVSANSVAPREVFMETARSVIRELKATMNKHLTPFWLASGTLLGWYRDCGIIPYTHDMDFGTWSSELNGILAKDFRENTLLKMIATLGLSGEDLEFWLIYKWLRVDLFFTYQNDNYFWVGGHNLGDSYSFRYLFPKFDLCSTDFLGLKVLIPCQVEEVLQAEYGPQWMTPVIKWNYETSARNVMGRRYWSYQETVNFFNQITSQSTP